MFVWIGKNDYVLISDIIRIKKYNSHSEKNRHILQATLCNGCNFFGEKSVSYIEAVYEDESMRDAAFTSLADLIRDYQAEKQS